MNLKKKAFHRPSSLEGGILRGYSRGLKHGTFIKILKVIS